MGIYILAAFLVHSAMIPCGLCSTPLGMAVLFFSLFPPFSLWLCNSPHCLRCMTWIENDTNGCAKSLHSQKKWLYVTLSVICLCWRRRGKRRRGWEINEWRTEGRRAEKERERREVIESDWANAVSKMTVSVKYIEAEGENERAWLCKCSCLENDSGLPGESKSA